MRAHASHVLLRRRYWRDCGRWWWRRQRWHNRPRLRASDHSQTIKRLSDERAVDVDLFLQQAGERGLVVMTFGFSDLRFQGALAALQLLATQGVKCAVH